MAQGYGEYHTKLLAKTAAQSAKVIAYLEKHPTKTYTEIGQALEISTNIVGKIIRNHKGVKSRWRR